MGHAASKEFLIAHWTELVNDPSLHDLPYKIELNEEGKIEMSPASNRHGMIQGHFAWALRNGLPHGVVITECSVLTEIGVRVPDVVWASREFVAAQGDSTPFTRAPEICVEIVSPSNSKREIDDKVKAFIAAGAKEVWIVSVEGEIRIFGAQGLIDRSSFGIRIELPPLASAGKN